MPEPLPEWALLAPLLLLFSASWLAEGIGRASGQPLWGVAGRWLRLGALSLALGYLAAGFGLDRPLWVLALLGALVMLALEGAAYGLMISAMSRSEVDLLPRFQPHAEEWPTAPQFVDLRDALRKAGFAKRGAAKARLTDDLHVRASLFENTDRTIRLQASFLPLGPQSFQMVLAFSSRTAEGGRLVTDNIHLPYGGYFPDGWDVARFPLVRQWRKLLEKHEARLAQRPAPPPPWDSDPVDDLIRQRQQVEMANVERGFFRPSHEQAEEGRLTKEGKARLWLELWSVHYLARPLRG